MEDIENILETREEELSTLASRAVMEDGSEELQFSEQNANIVGKVEMITKLWETHSGGC